MKKVLALFCVLTIILVGCQSEAANNSDTSEKELKSKVVLIIGQDDESEVVLSDEDAKKLHDLLDSAVYDGDQYDEETNPDGYRMNLANSDYTLVEKKGDEIIQTIYVWKETDHMKKQNKWYFCTDTKEQIIEIVEKYV